MVWTVTLVGRGKFRFEGSLYHLFNTYDQADIVSIVRAE